MSTPATSPATDPAIPPNTPGHRNLPKLTLARRQANCSNGTAPGESQRALAALARLWCVSGALSDGVESGV